MIAEAALGMFYNAAILLFLGVLYFLSPVGREQRSLGRKLGEGAIIGILGISLILTRWEPIPGLFLDTRSVILVLSALFFGPIPSLVAGGITSAFRISHGGVGAVAGVLIIFSSVAIGLAWRRRLPGRTGWMDLLGLGLVTHVVMLLCMLAMPLERALETLRQITLPVLVIYPLATMLLGRLLEIHRERQQERQDVDRNARRLQAMLKNAWGILNVVDPEGSCAYVSPPVKAILGYDPEEVEGRDFMELIHPDDRQQAAAGYERLVSTPGGMIQMDLRLQHKDGRWLWTENVGQNLLDDPDIRAVVINTRDITASREAQEALARSEEVYRTLVEGIPDYILRFDLEGRHLFASENVEEITGIPAQEFIGKTHADLSFPPELCRFWDEKIREVINTGRPVESRFWYQAGDGRVYLDWRLFPEYTPEGEVGSVFSVSRDITVEQEAEEKLRAQRERLANVIEGTGVGTWEWNVVTGETVFDERWATILGYTLNELQPTSIQTWQNLTHPEDLADARQKLEAHFSGEEAAYICEFRMRHRDGRWIWILDRGKVIEWTDDGQPLRMFGTHTDITARREAEMEKQLLSDLVEHSLNEIFVFHADTLRFNRTSRGARENLGYSAEELGLLTPLDLKPEFTEAGFRARLEPLIAGETDSVVFETIHRRKDGSTYPVGVFLSYQAATHHMLAIILDLTERVAAERELREREEHQRSLLASSPMAIFTLSREGVVQSWNPAAEKIFGWTADEAVGRVIPVVRDGEMDELKALIERVWSGEIIRNMEVRRQRKDGSILTVSLSAAPIRGHDGAPVGVMSILTDITEHRRAEAALEEERALLEQIMASSPMGIALLDAHGSIVYMNPAGTRILRIPSDEVMGKPVEELDVEVQSPEGSRLEGDSDYQKVLETGASFTGLQRVVVLRDGSRISIQLNIAPVNDPDGQPRAVIMLFEDITRRMEEQKKREEIEAELRQAQKLEAVGRLAGGVAHDFNNMLAVIMGAAEMALPEVEEGSSLHEDLQHINNAAERSADLTRQLLAFSRKQIIRPRVLNLNEIIQVQEKMLRRLIGEDIQVHLALQEDLWKVRVDPSQVDQILANLLVNARDAIPGVGRVSIDTENVLLDQDHARPDMPVQDGGYVLLAVSDNGIGMDRETRDRIFEPFFTTKDQHKGTGLGLSTVYGIVQQAHGIIHVQSEEGIGTTFKIYLPRWEGEAEGSTGGATQSLRGTETVLVVEDEPSILSLAQRFLEDQGYTVMTARTPMEAIGMVHENRGPIHLLLTDVVMPGMNGKQLQARISEILPKIRTLFMSGYTADVIAQRGVLEEDVEFIQKPFSMTTLTQRVREVLDRE